MNIKDFDYQLPADFIAQEPLTIRHNSKLMVLNKNTGKIQHKNFYQIVDLFQPEDLLVLNNSKVLPMRLFGQKKNTGGEIEALLINPISSNVWRALLKPGKRIHNGTIISFSEELEGIVIDKDNTDSTYLVQMNYIGIFNDILYKIGKMPTPPYIKKEINDSSSYQTVYAQEEGSIAAPTAGFHFTKELLASIAKKGVKIIYITLHIGRGTFEMIREDQIEKHKMKPELYTISEKNSQIIEQSLKKGTRIIGVGTSVTRTLESSVKKDKITTGTYWTDLFIYPGFNFKVVDALITNFHLPRSTPLMLASAFAGKENLLNAYQEAIKNKYRFYSFGDSMFIN